MARRVIISNSNLNSYGFRVLTSGIDVSQYQRNPILLWMHNRAYGMKEDEVLPIGRVENVAVEGDNLVGELVFSESYEFAQKIQKMWDEGNIKMVSAGLDVIEQSDAPEYLVQGQKRMTITKSKLREVSVVDLGANDDALALYNKGTFIKLSDKEQNDFIKPIKQHSKTNQMTFEQIALKLSLPQTATESEIIAAIASLQQEAAETVNLRAEMAKQSNAAITAAVENAIKLRKITADKKDHFVELGKKAGLESLNETLELMHPASRPTDILNESAGSSEFKKLSDVPSDQLMKLRDENPALYKQLYKAEYGIEPTID